jgi:hypothetical protein
LGVSRSSSLAAASRKNVSMQMGYRFLPSLLALDLAIFQTLTPGK